MNERQLLMLQNDNELKMNTEMNYDAELLAIELEEKRIAKMKSALMIKKHMGDKTFQQSFLTNIKGKLTIDKKDIKEDIDLYKYRITALEKEIADYETKIERLETDDETATEKLEEIEGIDFDEDDVETYIAENFQEEAIAYIEEQNKPKIIPTKKPATKATLTAKPAEKPKQTRAKIDRKNFCELLPDKMVLTASANKKGTKEKITKTIIYNAEERAFYLYDKEETKKYATLTAANNEWCEERGLTKDRYENAYEAFKALNLTEYAAENPKPEKRSIQHLHTHNWIEDSISEAADFIDADWEWAEELYELPANK
jgi:hypothetical protein